MAQFDHEKLDVFRLELDFVSWSTSLMDEVRKVATIPTTEVRDQLDRAGTSMPLNTAEGNAKRQRRTRARFFDDARGSAAECSACLDVLVAKGACSADRVEEGKSMVFRIASMLTRLVQIYDPTLLSGHGAHGSTQRAGEGEDEYDDEYEHDGSVS